MTVTVLSAMVRPLVEPHLPDWVDARYFSRRCGFGRQGVPGAGFNVHFLVPVLILRLSVEAACELQSVQCPSEHDFSLWSGCLMLKDGSEINNI